MSGQEHRLTYEEAAVYLGVAVKTLQKMVAQRRITYYKYGKAKSASVRFDLHDLDIYLKNHCVKAMEV